MKLNLEDIGAEGHFVFLAMMKTAITLKKMGKNKNDFVEIAKEIWNSMELSDLTDLENIIHGAMMKDIEEYAEKQKGNK